MYKTKNIQNLKFTIFYPLLHTIYMKLYVVVKFITIMVWQTTKICSQTCSEMCSFLLKKEHAKSSIFANALKWRVFINIRFLYELILKYITFLKLMAYSIGNKWKVLYVCHNSEFKKESNITSFFFLFFFALLRFKNLATIT